MSLCPWPLCKLMGEDMASKKYTRLYIGQSNPYVALNNYEKKIKGLTFFIAKQSNSAWKLETLKAFIRIELVLWLESEEHLKKAFGRT